MRPTRWSTSWVRKKGWLSSILRCGAVAALQVAREIDAGVIVAIFPDFGDRYLSTNLWVGWRIGTADADDGLYVTS